MNEFAPTIILITTILVALVAATAATICLGITGWDFPGVGVLFWFAALLFPLLLATWGRSWGVFTITMVIYVIVVIAPAGAITVTNLFDIKRKETSRR